MQKGWSKTRQTPYRLLLHTLRLTPDTGPIPPLKAVACYRPSLVGNYGNAVSSWANPETAPPIWEDCIYDNR
jgi:hypothetical protein